MLNAAILGAGFIGQSFIEFALEHGYNLRVLDHKSCPAEFDGRLTWVQGNLSSEEAVRKVLQKSDIVFHFISSTVPGDVADEGGELIQNVVETLHLLKLCLQEKVSRVVFISSASVYGVQPVLPIAETALTDPISSHGIHKLSIEKYLQLYKYQYGLDCKIMRLSNPYGPRQSIKGRQGFVAIALGKILAGDAISIRGDGSAIRDFIYIADVCSALHLLAITKVKDSVFNVGSGQGYSLNQVVEGMEKITEQRLVTSYVASRFVDIPASVLDVSRAREQLGHVIKYSLEQGLAETFAFHGIKLAANSNPD
ncbi:putative UDP-glucose-4-epimerase [Herminiimonas arsenicoxydans]|uniref:UDP-glucose-4-epimerase n=1 Tax=Herminiimonas arsenicoxydans TaxID=204773 RepID=A4G474_HERAR|nr:putative UDP-glucose-4-epimerase [Herminiimonas arsenicoxydans]